MRSPFLPLRYPACLPSCLKAGGTDGVCLSSRSGNHSSRAILFDAAGAIAAVAQKEFQQYYPQAGWVEHDPTEILTSQLSCAVEALGKAGARAARRCRHRHHQPARDGHRVGTHDGQAYSSGDRVAGSPNSSAVRTPGAKRRWRKWSRRKPASCSIRIFPRLRSSGYSTTSKARGRVPIAASWLRHCRQLADLAPDQRPHACDRRDQPPRAPCSSTWSRASGTLSC